MATKKYKATGCARLFLVLLILLPLAYFGAKTIGGGEGIPVVDDFIESIFKKKEVNDTKSTPPTRIVTSQSEIDRIRKDNLLLQRHVSELEEEIEELKNELKKLKEE